MLQMRAFNSHKLLCSYLIRTEHRLRMENDNIQHLTILTKQLLSCLLVAILLRASHHSAHLRYVSRSYNR